ncbi:FAD/NAD(P)-binding domain-containing protein [Wolfiporia cocos MD-104 SS10]|uniref:FAD/NAD(P)-binding domain-containing protein n=1 Tax=Wolfiporia cocos (strain MD-104) TaxID=742152 RepID=A0A2H3J310_WOLCO|nr:FAD/NAD(P)-binding domain-containing protein [Wolfiporia cocos MD-104 SS10]
MSAPISPVLIVGAGPACLVLALTLQNNGIPRGVGIQPGTLDLYDFLGVLPDVLAKGTPMVAIRIYKLPGGTEPIKTVYVNSAEEPTAAIPYNNAEAILWSHLAQYNCHVELGTELRGFEQHPDHVLTHIVSKNGAVEEQESFTVLASQNWIFVQELAIVGETGLKGLEKGYMYTWGDHSSLRILLRATENEGGFSFGIVWNLDYLRVVMDREEFIRVIRQGTDRDDMEFGELKSNVRMIENLSEDRVFLAGGMEECDIYRVIKLAIDFTDAAHVHSPTGGQEMNSSAQDAVLQPRLEARTGRARLPPSLLSTYGKECLPVIAEMLKESTKLLEQRVAAQRDGSGSEAAWNAGDLMKQLTINCLWSSIVRDERMPAGEKSAVDPYGLMTAKGDPIRAGDRAPDAPGLVDANTGSADAISLFRVFVKVTEAYSRDIIHVVVIRSQDATDVVTAVGTAYMDLIDREGHAYKNYSVAAGRFTAVIVRPDGVVGGIVSGGKGLKGYFDTIKFSI